MRRVAERLAKAQATVRVLVVMAEATGSRPLAMRLEREKLRQLFEEEILPHRDVEVDVLCHGVTREELCERGRSRGGYHIVHWSGHGHHNRLELTGEDGGSDWITGEGLVELFVDAGGFIPQLVFLSACHSGAFIERDGWVGVQAALRGAQAGAGTKAASRSLAEALAPENAPGYTGTALALVRSGVPQVVAMRYEVGDDYARELAWWFYKRLLADRGQPSTEEALALARGDVLKKGSAAARRMPVDRANPLVFGQEGRRLEPGERRSKQMKALRPKPQPLLQGGGRELERPEFFVGRGRALTEFNRAWQRGGAAVTVVQGMAGFGKTSLAAEAVHLWHTRFDWVLAFQAKGTALAVDEFLRQVDLRLTAASAVYREKCKESPYEQVWFESSEKLKGEARYERMRVNLVETLRDEAVLLVLDNFESNLEEVSGDGGCACKDPRWDSLLEVLAEQLPGTRSRVVMTTRHWPRALTGSGVRLLPLGPLPVGEAVLYVRSHEGLSGLLGDEDGCRLAEQMLRVSRGHPLILDRLASLVGDRKELEEALRRLESKGLNRLPELTVRPSREQAETERKYLEDVAVGSVDLLLGRVSAAARRLLWVLTQANEAVSEAVLTDVWAERSEQQEEVHPLLRELYRAGLISCEESLPAKEGASANVAFHELVRERIVVWMDQHIGERDPRTAEQIWVAYGQRYAAKFIGLHMFGEQGTRETAAEFGRRALVYLVRAGDFEELTSFASRLITDTHDPTLLEAIVAELRAVVEHVPMGKARWCVRAYLASALTRSARSDIALPLFEQAAAAAVQAEHWGDVAWICGSWAHALTDVGRLDASKATHLRCAEAERKAGRPRVRVVASELEALRIDVMQGHAEQALEGIEKRLEQVRGWWRAQVEGKFVPEAPDPEVLGRSLVSGLNIACMASLALESWQDGLDLLEEELQTSKAMRESAHEQARMRFNKYGPLLRLGRLEEAQWVLEGCLLEFRRARDTTSESRALSALASLWAERGDVQQAADLERQALVLHNRLPNPQVRAASHNNLANDLDALGQADASTHRVAALVCLLVIGNGELIPLALRNISLSRCKATAAGTIYEIPRLEEMLVRPAFDALRRFLMDRSFDIADLQATIDRLLDQAAQAVQTTPTSSAQIHTPKSEAEVSQMPILEGRCYPESEKPPFIHAVVVALILGLVAAAWTWFSS